MKKQRSNQQFKREKNPSTSTLIMQTLKENPTLKDTGKGDFDRSKSSRNKNKASKNRDSSNKKGFPNNRDKL